MIVTEGAASNTWTAATIAAALNYDPTSSTGAAPQPSRGGGGATAKSESDQVAGKLGPAITVYEPEAYARMIGEAD